MARFDVDAGLQDMLNSLSSLDMHQFAPITLSGCASEIMLPELIAMAEKHSVKDAKHPYRTGSMLRSIKPDKKVTNRNGSYKLMVRPSGKDRKGVRNMEKLAYLEFGVASHKQPATPVISPACKKAEPKVLDKMQQDFNDYAQKHGL